MRLLLMFFCTWMIHWSMMAQANLEVVVKNIRVKKGSIQIAIFNNEKDFLKKELLGKTVKVEDAEVRILFENLPPGEYGLSLFHDENENGELDKNFMGIPKEGFAFGNNAMGTFGPPSFDKAKFKIENDVVKQDINLRFM